MRRTNFARAAGALVFFALEANALAAERDDAPPVRMADSLHLDLGLSVVGAGYERAVAEHASLQVEALFYKPWYVSDHVWGLGGQVRPFFFLTRPAPYGFYVSPLLRVEYVLATVDADTGKSAGFTGGLTAGYSFQLGRRWILRGGAGVQYMSWDLEAGGQSQSVHTFWPTLDLSIGASF